MSDLEYDVVVIGAGAVGENVAERAVQGGLSTVVVEAQLVGGACSYWACMPSKVLLRSAAALRAAQSVAGSKEAVLGDLDVGAVLARRTSITHDWNDQSQVDWLSGAGIDLLRGRAKLAGPKRVAVTARDGSTQHIAARHAVAVCTGSAASIPNIPGLAAIEPWTSEDATSASQPPASLAIIGGGVVAVEMATAYAGFGTQVTLLARSQLLADAEPFVGELVTAGLHNLGVDVRCEASVIEVGSHSPSRSQLTLTDGKQVLAEKVLIATGRRPRTDQLGLESVDLEPGEWVAVDDTMLVPGTDWLYAVGDVNGRALLTHQGKYQARAAGDVIAARAAGRSVDDQPWGAHVATADHSVVPQVIFSEPEVAAVGLTAKAAQHAGLTVQVVDFDLSQLAGTATYADDYVGHARMVVDEDRQVVVGATFVGANVAELLHSATVAIGAEVPIARLWHAVPSYPTISEAWLRLLEAYRDGATNDPSKRLA